MTLNAIREPPNNSLGISNGFQFTNAYFTINEDSSVTAYSRDYLYHLREDIDSYVNPQNQPIPYGQITSTETLFYQEYSRIVKDKDSDTICIYSMEEKLDFPIPSMILTRVKK